MCRQSVSDTARCFRAVSALPMSYSNDGIAAFFGSRYLVWSLAQRPICPSDTA